MFEFFAVISWVLGIATLIVLAITDFKTYLLPNRLVGLFALLGGVFHLSNHWALLTPAAMFWGMVVGGGFLLIIRTTTHEDALGLGDVKLMMAAGLWLGLPAIFMALAAGAVIGVIHGVFMHFQIKRQTGKAVSLNEIDVPAGVGFAIGIVIAHLHEFGLSWLP